MWRNLLFFKYLADQTSEKVKRRVIEIIYSWTKGLSNETKIQEAYDMLKRQGIIDKDPTNVDTVSVFFKKITILKNRSILILIIFCSIIYSLL